MPKKISDLAAEKVPSLPDRISLFRSKLQIAHYAPDSITDYCHALHKPVAYLGKLPDDFTQTDDGQVQIQLGGTPVPEQRKKKNYLLICRQKGWPIGICGKCGAKMQPFSILKPSHSPPKVVTESAMIAATL